MMAMSSWKINVNLAIVSVAFFCNMLSYMTMEGLQSSLNAEAGTQSVSAKYVAYVLASFFLPTLAMEFFSSRIVIILGTVPYILFTVANLYPKTYIMVPVGVLLGCGSSIIWTAKRVYVSDLAVAYAKNKGRDEGSVTSHFYGIFWATFSLSLIVGNVLSSAVINNFGMELGEVNATSLALNVTQVLLPANTTVPPEDKQILRCALHDCDEGSRNFTGRSSSDNAKSQIKPEVLYALFGAFAAMQLGSLLLLLCFADDAPDRNATLTQNESTENGAAVYIVSGNESPSMKKQIGKNAQQKKRPITKRVVEQILATIKFLIYNHNAKAMIPITIHIGALQSWALAQFTKYWVTCVIGIQYIGYVSAMLGLGSVIGGYGSGYLAQYTGRSVIMAIAWAVDIAVMVFLMSWEPELQTDVWIFFVVFALIGMLHTTYKTMVATATTMIFSSDKEAASATLCIWDPLGSAIIYIFTSIICNRSFIKMLMILVSFGTALELIVEGRHQTKTDKENGEKVPAV